MDRRHFIGQTARVSLGVGMSAALASSSARDTKQLDARQYLEKILYTRKEVDDWLAGKGFPFSKYHPEFGWLLNNASFKDGVDQSVSVYTYEGDDGPRITTNYREKPCRINTYGNSFTQCHQVSDHETWQEILAAHLQEPVRNFGIGGWSVYQAYLRMLKEEKRTPADVIIFNIYEDDHRRNLDAWRNIRVRKHPQHIESPLPYVKVNMKNDTLIECPNPCPTPECIYKLCDINETMKLFQKDFVLQIMLAHHRAADKNPDAKYSDLNDIIQTHGIETKLDHKATLSENAKALHWKTAFFSTRKLLEKIELFAGTHNKQVLYVLSYPGKEIARYIDEGIRFDQEIVDYFEEKNLPYVDLMAAHARDYSEHRLDMKSYLKKYFIGHYNPLGNFFCAFRIREKLVDMLNPKPIPYQSINKQGCL